MNSIADALVYAVAYINCRVKDDGDVSQDVGALESIAGLLEDSTRTEQDALAAAAIRALTAETTSQRPRPDFMRDYANWMEDMFGEGWEGNSRAQG
jgi:hypothetical protein